MVKTQPNRRSLACDCLVEHATEGYAVYRSCLDRETDDAATKLIHHDQDPMRLEQDRFRPEQVQAPEAVLGMTQEGQPRWAIFLTLGTGVTSQNTTDHVFVDLDTKGLGQVLRNPGTAKTRIAPFEFTDGLDQFRGWPFGSWLTDRKSTR